MADLVVPLVLEELLNVAAGAADDRRLPLVWRARGIGREQSRLAVFDAGDQQGCAVRSRPTALGVLLNVVGEFLRQGFHVDRLAVAKLADLSLSASEIDELAGVSDVAGRGRANVVVDLVELFDALGFHERRARAALGGDDDAVGRPDTDARRATRDGLAGVLDLIDPTVRRKQ